MHKSLTPDDSCFTCRFGRRDSWTLAQAVPITIQVVHCKKNIPDPQASSGMRQMGVNRPEFKCMKFQSRDPRRR